MNMRKYMIALAASLALFTGRANAQRCLPGMQGIEVKAAMTEGTVSGRFFRPIRKTATNGRWAVNTC